MRYLKKILPLLLVVLLCTPAHAQEVELTGVPTATGVLASAKTQDILAPFSGTLLPHDLDAGDLVKRGEALLSLDTTPVYAPYSGTLGAVFAAEGDSAQDVISRYGALAAIEPENPYILNASTASAYDDAENKFIHVGETLYFKSTSTKRITGQARVIAVDGDNYVAEITQGALEIKEKANLYRDPLYDSDSNVGRGTCVNAPSVLVQGSGRILKSHAKEGDMVAAGDLLFETVAADAAPQLRTTQITAPFDGVLAQLHAAPGQQVYKGQVLLSLHDASVPEVTCDVDEIDLGSLRVGDTLPIRFDALPDVTYQGSVTKISALGTLKQNAAYYTVTLSVDAAAELRLGMSATVYLTQH